MTRLLLAFVHAYRAVWHRIHLCLDQAGWRFRVCHYHPSCSQYALDALHKYPAWTAVQLTIFRIHRCHIAKDHPYVMPDRLIPDDEAE